MPVVTVGKPAPDFTLPSTSEEKLKLSSLQGKNVILYFYPKDCTPGCTLESQTFRDYEKQFSDSNTVILGISRDTIKSHHNFKQKEQLNFELLSDEEEEVCNLYEVLKQKNMYGKKVWGIERSTFLIDPKGIVQNEWRKVKVEGHVEEVLAAVKGLV